MSEAEKKNIVEWLHEQQSNLVTKGSEAYATGLNNGMELALAALEGREPIMLLVKPNNIHVRLMTAAEKEAQDWTKEKIMGTINDMLNIQHGNVFDPYSAGMYNGIEAVAATLEKREPVMMDCPDRPMVDRLGILLDKVREEKPTERSEAARHYAIFVTEFEKLYAYYFMWVAEMPNLRRKLEEQIAAIQAEEEKNIVDKETFRKMATQKWPNQQAKVHSMVFYRTSDGRDYPALVLKPYSGENNLCDLLVFHLNQAMPEDIHSWNPPASGVETWTLGKVPYSVMRNSMTWHWPE